MTFARLLSEATASPDLPATGDVLAVGLPFLRQLADLHEHGLVSRLDGVDHLLYADDRLTLAAGATRAPLDHAAAVRHRNPDRSDAGVVVRRRLSVDHDAAEARGAVRSLDVVDGSAPPDRPVLVVGYRAWEQLLGHHDPLTDIHLAGLVLTSYATGLDLADEDQLHRLALGRRHLVGLNPALHPVVAGVLAEMIDPDRHARPGDLADVVSRLEHHRELPPDLDLSDAYHQPGDWRPAVLAALRERVFDVSRRNRALYFRPTAASVSLTEASVPLLLDVERIRPADLLTWNDDVATELLAGTPIDLERWCRFEEAPHLAPALDAIAASERRLRAEHGHGRLQLVVAMLRWVDPDTGEAITSPFVTLRAELEAVRGVRRRYRLRCDPEGEVNPVLRHVFAQRFDITLPSHLEPTPAAVAALTASLEQHVRATDPSIAIELVDRPRISVIRHRARLRVEAYLRRRARSLAAGGRWRRQSHSYDHDDWRPLGLALYRSFVAPPELPLRLVAGAPPRRRPPPDARFAARERERERERDNYAVEADADRHRWEVDLCAVTLASFGTRRTNLARDYDDAIERVGRDDPAPGALASFETIFEPRPRRIDQPPLHGFAVEQPLVLPADDSQARAVRRAVAEESFIVQGPPGTGKSQTIANLIAALVADGKRVLFVCEKRAAIDVVAHRLAQAGLGELVATIHDSQLDRKAFVADLGATYAHWTAPPDDAASRRDDALAAVRQVLDPLEEVYLELADATDGRVPASEIVVRLAMARAAGVTQAQRAPGGVDAATWLAARPLLDRVAAARPTALATTPLGAIASLRVAPAVAAEDEPVAVARRTGGSLRTATEAVLAIAPDATLGDVAAIVRRGSVLTATVEGGGAAALAAGSPAHAELRQAAGTLTAAEQRAVTTATATERWHSPLPAADARAALEVASAHETSWWRYFNGRWRSVRRTVEAAYRFDAHQVRPSLTSVLTDLVAHHDALEALEVARTAAVARWGTADPGALAELVTQLSPNPLLAALARTVDVTIASQVLAAAHELDAAAGAMVLGSAVSLHDLARLAAELERTPVSHGPMLVAWAALAAAPPAVAWAALDPSASIEAIEVAVLLEALDRTAAADGGPLAGARLDDACSTLADRYRDLLAANAGMVLERARARFRERMAFSESSMAGRSASDKELKRAYAAGRRLLEREFQKKMRFRAIRELAGGDSGRVVADLKPVWMMSPLSVSDTLPLPFAAPGDGDGDGGAGAAGALRFDVVVFDEASQIPVEDAVPTLLRAPQVIVVGDRMQLPPTRFFAAGDDVPDDVVVEVDGQPESVALDADSFLAQADLALPSALLNWHYRSRSEALIAYSNHAFYGGRLATVPDRDLPGPERSEIVVPASGDAVGSIADRAGDVHARPISFHRIAGAVYEDRRNAAEAAYVAELVRALLVDEAHPRRSIGVVAFSEAQQAAIEAALAELGALDPAFALRLEQEEAREEGGELVGLFVKNLENVQGDERDIIVMSVCYGPGPDGRMRMNFGPINQNGGERRLNVIFSRAKHHMVVVSSIDAGAITNLHNEGAQHLARFLAFAAAESRCDGAGGDVLAALGTAVTVPTAGSATGQAGAPVAAQIADALRARGHRVDVGVGRSGFTIDVAVRGDGGYRLGVALEPQPTDVAARLITEQAVLVATGWRVARVAVTDWWHDPDGVVDRLEARLAG